MTKRQEVYDAIDTEIEYREIEIQNPTKINMIEDFNMGSAMQALNVLHSKAGDTWYSDSPETDYQDTMEILRKVASVCVQMGEKYGMPNRGMPKLT